MRMKGKSGRGSGGKGTSSAIGSAGGQRDLNVRLRTARSRTASSQRWLERQLNDPYVSAAKRAGYRSRAAYKIIEIDDKYHFLKPGGRVVDLGAAPGAWSQYLRRKFTPKGAGGGQTGEIFALDLLEFEPIEGVSFLQGDFHDEAVVRRLEEMLGGRAVDLVVSDMAPNLSGVASSDSARVANLVELAVEFAERHLVPHGALVCKVFHGSGYSQLVERFKRSFKTVKPIKPKASRDRSAETFLVGRGLKDAVRRADSDR